MPMRVAACVLALQLIDREAYVAKPCDGGADIAHALAQAFHTAAAAQQQFIGARMLDRKRCKTVGGEIVEQIGRRFAIAAEAMREDHHRRWRSGGRQIELVRHAPIASGVTPLAVDDLHTLVCRRLSASLRCAWRRARCARQ
jgi:hypothetical protein